MDPSEAEFVAEKHSVQIVPNFSQDKIYLISGDIGPFNAGLPVDIPLWLAVNLRQRQKCKIVPPTWMNVDQLQDVKKEETDQAFFTKMPNENYMEISHLILNNAASDVPRADEIRILVKDIWDLRIAKLRKSIDTFINGEETYARLDHLTVMEINTVREFLTTSLDFMHHLRSKTHTGPIPSQSTQS